MAGLNPSVEGACGFAPGRDPEPTPLEAETSGLDGGAPFEGARSSANLQLVIEPPGSLVLSSTAPLLGAQHEFAGVLSPTQVRTFLDCSARWWFKYGLAVPELKTSSLALGSAVHGALEVNFREKLETGEDLDTLGVVALFRDFWQEVAPETHFHRDEDPIEIGRLGERLIAKYMDEAAPLIQPTAVELDVAGEIAGVAVRGRVDVIDLEGRIIDIKTSARRPTVVSPDYAFQIATYRQMLPGASGRARLDTLVKTRRVQLVAIPYTVTEADLRATEALYPLAQDGMRSGLYLPNRQSLVCSRRQCAFWRYCEQEFGGTVRER